MDALDVQMTTVPYKGTGPAMTDLLGGQVDVMCDQTTNTVNQIKSGKIKGYAVTTKEAAGRAARSADAGGSRPRGLRDDGLARALRAEGNAQGDRR